jgi:DNA polymerase II small subunit
MKELQHKKRKLVELLLERKILIEPEFLQQLNSLHDPQQISDLINTKLVETTAPSVQQTQQPIIKRDGKVNVVFSYKNIPRKITAQDFITHFNARYTAIKKILQQRTQLENVSSINKLRTKQEKEVVSVIGMVYDKEDTKNGMMITVEDPTGSIKVFFNKSKQDLFTKAADTVRDEVIGITGSLGKNIIFGNDLIFPDVPVTKEMKKSPVEEYAAFISDIHIGSKKFLEEEFLKFLSWIRGDIGTEKQKEVAAKVKYLFITGDAVDGISVYPSQKEELALLTYRAQYLKLVEYLRMVPTDIQIIICPGNHDVVRIAEPQPIFPEQYCKELYELPNITVVSNPALVNIAAQEGFPGFDVLMYHGYSYNYYADVVESIRIQKPNISERADLVMKFLLQKRHLAPTYEGNPHMPTEHDHLVIEKVPDIFVSGDVHRSAVFTYKGVVTGIIGSCFQAKTDFQEWVGHVPDPGRVPIINLKTREVKLLNFGAPFEPNT